LLRGEFFLAKAGEKGKNEFSSQINPSLGESQNRERNAKNMVT
jgi:hypothetical protein